MPFNIHHTLLKALIPLVCYTCSKPSTPSQPSPTISVSSPAATALLQSIAARPDDDPLPEFCLQRRFKATKKYPAGRKGREQTALFVCSLFGAYAEPQNPVMTAKNLLTMGPYKPYRCLYRPYTDPKTGTKSNEKPLYITPTLFGNPYGRESHCARYRADVLLNPDMYQAADTMDAVE